MQIADRDNEPTKWGLVWAKQIALLFSTQVIEFHSYMPALTAKLAGDCEREREREKKK
jgi:hypothetical protein